MKFILAITIFLLSDLWSASQETEILSLYKKTNYKKIEKIFEDIVLDPMAPIQKNANGLAWSFQQWAIFFSWGKKSTAHDLDLKEHLEFLSKKVSKVKVQTADWSPLFMAFQGGFVETSLWLMGQDRESWLRKDRYGIVPIQYLASSLIHAPLMTKDSMGRIFKAAFEESPSQLVRLLGQADRICGHLTYYEILVQNQGIPQELLSQLMARIPEEQSIF